MLTARTDGTPSREPRCFSANDLLATISAAAPSRRRADVEQPQRVGDHRAGQHVLDGGFFAVAGVGVVQAVAGVFDLDLREVLQRGAVEVHAAAGQQGEVDGVGRADEVEALPVGVVFAFSADRGEEAFGGGVGADDQGDVAESGQDLGACACRAWEPEAQAA